MEDAVGQTQIQPDSIIRVLGQNKEELFSAIAKSAALLIEGIDRATIEAALWERENLLSTRLDDHVAMPHAQLGGTTRSAVIVAVCPDGIVYDGNLAGPVNLVVSVIGDPASHLATLSRVARALNAPTRLDRIVAAATRGDTSAVLSHLAHQESPEGHADGTQQARSTRVWMKSLELAHAVGARCVLLHASASQSKRFQVPDEFAADVFVITPDDLGMPHQAAYRFTGGVSIALLYALTENRVRQDDIVVAVSSSDRSGLLDTIQVTDVSAAFKLFFSVSRELSMEASTQRVMLRVVELVVEIADEGREGKPVGALFVVGDTDAVRPHCQQMLMNPFKGYDPEHRNVLDPGLTETVKELSRIDGAFVVTDSGVIESAGTYLRVDADVEDLPSGLGARHAAAAAITAVSEAVAIAVSESTRQVSIFRHGRRILVL